jgi:hypothetical protein
MSKMEYKILLNPFMDFIKRIMVVTRILIEVRKYTKIVTNL